MIYNKEMKRPRDFNFSIQLSRRKKKKWVEFQDDLSKYRSTTPICLYNVLKCHDRDMALLQPN